tara:strand:+ start:1779 stop:1958 length:180 start_codon:yes stop_codon:yes gene_type:complete
MKTYKQFMVELVKSLKDMQSLGMSDIVKGMDIIDKTSGSAKDKATRRKNFAKDLGVPFD